MNTRLNFIILNINVIKMITEIYTNVNIYNTNIEDNISILINEINNTINTKDNTDYITEGNKLIKELDNKIIKKNISVLINDINNTIDNNIEDNSEISFISDIIVNDDIEYIKDVKSTPINNIKYFNINDDITFKTKNIMINYVYEKIKDLIIDINNVIDPDDEYISDTTSVHPSDIESDWVSECSDVLSDNETIVHIDRINTNINILDEYDIDEDDIDDYNDDTYINDNNIDKKSIVNIICEYIDKYKSYIRNILNITM